MLKCSRRCWSERVCVPELSYYLTCNTSVGFTQSPNIVQCIPNDMYNYPGRYECSNHFTDYVCELYLKGE